MKNNSVSRAALATAASLFFTAIPFTATYATDQADQNEIKCSGMNGCSGKNESQPASNGCPGKSDTQDHTMMTSRENCLAKGGKIAE